MTTFKSFNDVVLSFIELLRLSQPGLDTKPGTVARDLFIDAPSEQIGELYNDLRNISSLQSFFSTSGKDLERLGSNFGAKKKTGANATGVATFTTNSLDVDILIKQGEIVTAKNGITFKTLSTVQMIESSSNVYKATATRLRADLNLASITDEFAIEVPVEATTSGTGGNIGKFTLVSQNVSGISNVINLATFSGGTTIESDAEFRARILGIFSGSNTGTALGYESAVNTIENVNDVITVVPGDPLLIRDGTQVVTNSDGNLVVSEPGGGGKVDLYILGSSLEGNIDSFIYNDQSGFNNPVNTLNDVILGQQGQDTTLSSSQRRVELLAGNLPFQPVTSIASVVGSVSGGNFVEKFTDTDGSIKGNFELVKDSGDFGGSSFGFDKIHFISNKIELDDENAVKSIFNGADSLLFTDVTRIRNITQDIFVTNENSQTNTTNRSSVQLLHNPVDTVSRVTNLTTGERYVVSDQNPDGTTGELNTTGRIVISGNTLPVGTDILQVDYTWVKEFDNVFDFDNLSTKNVFRTVQDSVDWAFGNMVTNEPSIIADAGGGDLSVTLTHNIQKVVAINTFSTETISVSSGAVTMSTAVTNIIDMRRVSDGVEVFNTDLADGALSGTGSVILPSDTLAIDGDSILVRFNSTDIFAPSTSTQGTFEDNVVTLSSEVSDAYGTSLLTTYIANVQNLIPSTEISALPIVKNVNRFTISDVTAGFQPTSNLFDSNGLTTTNLRRAASNIKMSASSIGSQGAISITGTTIHKVTDALVTIVAGNGFDINLSSIINSDLSVSSFPTTVSVVKLESVERVDLNSSGIVESVDNTYDVVNYRIKDDFYDLEKAIKTTSLDKSVISLPRTTDNTAAVLVTGDIVRVTFYYIVVDDTEQLFFSRNNTQITEKVFSDVDRISLASGFLNAAGTVTGEILVNNLNQPIVNTTYDVDYNYTAPKENERITVTFNNNSVIRDATLAIEGVRPITADVLIKEAEAKNIDVNISIVLLSTFVESEETVKQDSIDSITAFLNASSLGTTIDASDVINNLYSVGGIDRARIINFSTGSSGNVLSIVALKNQFLRAGNITINVEVR